jgi:protein involved in polysaccharide export with SLBB domain
MTRQLLHGIVNRSLILCTFLAALLASPVTWAQTSLNGLPANKATDLGLPSVLATPSVPTLEQQTRGTATGTLQPNTGNLPGQSASFPQPPREPPPVSEFETYVRRLSGTPTIRRFGIGVVTPGQPEATADYSPLVPPDYLVQVGDEIAVTIWGSVDADLRVVVDRSGRISLPRIGSVMLAGVRYADLPSVVGNRVGQVFKNFQISVSLGQLRGVRVYVTGFVARPGDIVVNALSTITAAVLRAGGPSIAGSLRDIELRRAGKVVARLDLYDLLLNGNRDADVLLQPGDVIRVGAVGPQVALIGSVNQPGIYELKPAETLSDVLKMAGGFGAIADVTRVTLERLEDRTSTRINELRLPADAGHALHNADIVRAFSAVDSALPVARQNKRVHVDGEVARPGDYLLPPTTTLADAVRAAGGLTESAYLYGTECTRESVRVQQEQNYERALRDLETEFARMNSSQRVSSSEEAVTSSARSAATSRIIERLRAVKPTGRVVLQLRPENQALPELALEDGDHLYVPPRPVTVGVFGSVFNPGSYLFAPSRDLQDYLRLAGGPTRGADKQSIFVVRANGTVVSALQSASWFGGVSTSFLSLKVEPGDTIFAPEEIDKTSLVQGFKDWTQILYQFGLGIAGLKVIGF